MPAARICAALVTLVKRPRLPSRTRTRASRSTEEERSSLAHSTVAGSGWLPRLIKVAVASCSSSHRPASCRPGAPSWRMVAAIRAARHSHAEVAAWPPGRFGREYPLRCPGIQAANHRLVSPGIVPTSGRSKRPIGRLAPPAFHAGARRPGEVELAALELAIVPPAAPAPPLSPGNGSNTAVRATAAGGAPVPRARRGQPAPARPPPSGCEPGPANPATSAYTYIAAHHQSSRQPGEFQGRRRPQRCAKTP